MPAKMNATKAKPAPAKKPALKAVPAPHEAEAAAVWVDVEQLVPWVDNPRKNDDAVEAVARSIKRFGWGAPLLARQANGEIIGGHTRLKAALSLGMSRVPVRYLPLDAAEAHLLALADNKTGELAEWDEAALAAILSKYGLDDALDAGFDENELEKLASALMAGEPVEEDEAPDVGDGPATTKLGDIWILGHHRLLCGDSTKPEDVARVMAKERAECMWTDPPYGVSYVGKTDEAMEIENDDLDPAELEEFLKQAFGAADSAALDVGAAIYVAHPAGPLSMAFCHAFVATGWSWRQTLIWDKESIALGHSDYHYRHEPILLGYKPQPKGNGRLGRGGEGWFGDNSQASVIACPKPNANREHPTMKPIALIVQMLLNSSRRGGLVFDPFGGSGSTLIACEETARRCCTIELSPKYCDVIVARWKAKTGGEPRLENR